MTFLKLCSAWCAAWTGCRLPYACCSLCQLSDTKPQPSPPSCLEKSRFERRPAALCRCSDNARLFRGLWLPNSGPPASPGLPEGRTPARSLARLVAMLHRESRHRVLPVGSERWDACSTRSSWVSCLFLRCYARGCRTRRRLGAEFTNIRLCFLESGPGLQLF